MQRLAEGDVRGLARIDAPEILDEPA